MTDMIYCGTIAIAARRMGIVIRKNGDSFTWLDTVTGAKISGQSNPDQRLAFKSACEELVNQIKTK